MKNEWKNLDSLFDGNPQGRPARAGRFCFMRRWGMPTLFLFLVSIIASYWYLTDTNRLRRICASYLSKLSGGEVEVRKAQLSIFEGLRLDGVSVRVDNSGRPDSALFDVGTVLLKYNPRSLLTGDIEATEILAIDPRVRIVENLDVQTRRWNYERLKFVPPPPEKGKTPTTKPMQLPQIQLRNGQVFRSQMRGGVLIPQGMMALDGSLSPSTDVGSYFFHLQSRVKGQSTSPVATGQANPGTGESWVGLEDFEFGPGVNALLPEVVRRFMEDLQIEGKIDVNLHLLPRDTSAKSTTKNATTLPAGSTELATTLPASDGGVEALASGSPAYNGPKFRVEMKLREVGMSLNPGEWLSRVERQQVAVMHNAFDVLRIAGLNGGVNGMPNAAALLSGHSGPATKPVGPIAKPSNAVAAVEGFIDHLEQTFAPAKIRLQRVRGKFIFTEKGVEIEALTGRVEDNIFRIDGQMNGYNADAPAELKVTSEVIRIPHSPRYVNSMPRVVRQIYEALHPEGLGILTIRMDRRDPSKKPVVAGELNIIDGKFLIDEFPYPLRGVTGIIRFGPDPVNGDKLELLDIHAHGATGGPNENKSMTINGLLSPIDGDSEMNIYVKGENIESEPAIRTALPRDARDALNALDPSGKGLFPTFKANIDAHVHRAPGPYKPFVIALTLDLLDAAGAFEGFSYPLQHVTGQIKIGEGYVNINKCISKMGDASVVLDGRLTFGKGKVLTPDITITARNAPIDETLLKAVSSDRRLWLEKLGITGKLDVDGHVFLQSKDGEAGKPPHAEVMTVLDMKVHDGGMMPQASNYQIKDFSGSMHMEDGEFSFTDLKGRRGDSKLTASGKVLFKPSGAELSLKGAAEDLLLEPALHGLLQADAQQAWDATGAAGTVDLELQIGLPTKTNMTPSPQPNLGNDPTVARPAVSNGLSLGNYQIILKPRKLSAKLVDFPYKLTDVKGQIEINPEKVILTKITAKHGDATLGVSGEGNNSSDTNWQLKLLGKDVVIDEELAKALPGSVSQLVQSMEFKGRLAFDFTKFNYLRKSQTAATIATSRPTTVAAAVAPPAHGPKVISGVKKEIPADIDMAGTLWFSSSSMQVGVPITEADGLLVFDTTVRNGKMGGFKGKLNASQLNIAGRPAKDFATILFKPADQPVMRFDKLQGILSKGEVAGQIDLGFPDDGPSRFGILLVLRNADITEFTGEKDIRGQLTASFSLEGNWTDPASRRGRGDVTISGQDMYHIPLMLGLMQITNLSLPISSPFSEGAARYIVDGQKITFESITLRASSMVMQGSGSMNFDTKKVKMTFSTDNPNWPKLPLVGDLLNVAKNELLQIKVSGTIEQPKVSGSIMPSFQTTIDEVFRGDEAQKNKQK